MTETQRRKGAKTQSFYWYKARLPVSVNPVGQMRCHTSGSGAFPFVLSWSQDERKPTRPRGLPEPAEAFEVAAQVGYLPAVHHIVPDQHADSLAHRLRPGRAGDFPLLPLGVQRLRKARAAAFTAA